MAVGLLCLVMLTTAVAAFGQGQEALRQGILTGIAAMHDGRWEEAAQAFEQLTRGYPRFELAHFFLGQSQYEVSQAASAKGDAETARSALKLAQGAFQAARDLEPDRSQTRAYLASIALSEEQFRRAVDLLSEEIVTRMPPSMAEIRNVLAVTYLKGGDAAGAIAECRRALREQPNYVEARFNMGLALATQGKHQDALDEYSRALVTISEWRSAESRLAGAMASGRRSTELTEETIYERYRFAEDFVREKGMWPVLYKAAGDACAAMGHYEDARNFYRRSLVRQRGGNPQDPDARTRIGMCTYKQALALLEQGELFTPWSLLQSSRRQFEEAIDFRSDYSEAYRGLGLVYLTEATRYREGMAAEIEPHLLTDAVEQFDKAVTYGPDNVQAWVDLAWAYRLNNEYDYGLNYATRALSLADPIKQTSAWVRAQTEVAHCLYGLGRFEEAVIAAQRAIQVDKTHAPAFIVEGMAEAALGRLGEALDSFTVATYRDPRSVEARMHLGDVLRTMGSWVRARGAYQRALDLLPKAELARVSAERARLLYLVGDCYLREHNLNRAVESLNEALSLDPGNYLAEKDLADAYLALNRYDAADRALGIALDLSPSLAEDAEIYVRLGQLAETRGLPHEAYKQYLLALRADATNPVAKTRLEALEK